jgi:seryl-tRNA synthetase
MHDIRLLRDHPDRLREGMRRRGKYDEFAPLLDRAEALERERRTAITELEQQQAARNRVTQEVAQRRKAGDDATALIAEGRALGDTMTALELRRNEADAAVQQLLYELPNITLDEVPEGGEEANRVLRTWGTPRADGAILKPHWEIGEALGILDIPRGAKISGSGFIVYRGAGARLVRSLMNLMLDIHTLEHGYEEVWVPLVVNKASMIGTSQLPKFADDMYALKDEDLFLIPTAEVPVTNLYRDEILDASQLPKGFCAFSACFRREAGSAGKDTRGLLRVHEFDKVELVRYAAPEHAMQELERLTGHAEVILQRLGLPYRVVLLATRVSAARKRTTSRSSRRVWASGSKCRAAACFPTFRRVAPTFGIDPRLARNRASCTRSTGRRWRSRVSLRACSNTINSPTDRCSCPRRFRPTWVGLPCECLRRSRRRASLRSAHRDPVHAPSALARCAGCSWRLRVACVVRGLYAARRHAVARRCRVAGAHLFARLSRAARHE